MDNWDEIRTAYHVARIGTVSGAAEVLGVHHATVIRHIDALEARLGVKLFQRHARGYTATEAGRELMKVAQATEDQFSHLAARLRGTANDISGELVVTSLPGLVEQVAPTLNRLQREHPELRVRYVSDVRLFRLEYGEAHVAIRAGGKPQEPDNVVQSFCIHRRGLYASPDYVERHGLPESEDDLARHRFVGPVDPENRAPFYRWLTARVPDSAFVVRTNEDRMVLETVRGGVAIGFLSARLAGFFPELVEVMPQRPEWDTPLWLVTHVDLHRTPRIQLFLKALKEDAQKYDHA
ncbi:DNA-binding transcriptional LysR family regulator [Albidovulum inexpectatum]|uniref:DNA-binding transcriptional LysR family regulator n=1 Tax=Albidovulum inexpectatum TaxID=196587 RepID=A0A2S5JGB5_9RHOB|nr:LysR family transcriptional regulator [Albidovulum inexpectatum]PPB80441.1 DNA-binding transcriptional LysR family regulator [Albidovulum inexpectatum]